MNKLNRVFWAHRSPCRGLIHLATFTSGTQVTGLAVVY